MSFQIKQLSFEDLLERLEVDMRTGALYPSAGRDTRLFAFTHAMFLARKGIDFVPSPRSLVYVDHTWPASRGSATLAFDAPEFRVRTVELEELDVEGLPTWLCTVEVWSERDGVGDSVASRVSARTTRTCIAWSLGRAGCPTCPSVSAMARPSAGRIQGVDLRLPSCGGARGGRTARNVRKRDRLGDLIHGAQ